MGVYFSAQKCAFYDDGIIDVSAMPSDAVAVSDAAYAELMAAQAAGKVIVAGSDGKPVAVEQSCGSCHCTLHELVKASETQLGHVTAGDIRDVVSPMMPTAATSSKLGIVRPDNSTIVVNDGVLSATVDISGKAEDDAVVHISGDETVNGIKTFSAIPQMPTAADGDSSSNGASTEFVGNAISSLANPIDYVVEEWYNSTRTMFYRKWKSGFVEQGGYSVPSSNKGSVTFPVPFATNYGNFLYLTDYKYGMTDVSERYSTITSFTATGFSYTGIRDRTYWHAFGRGVSSGASNKPAIKIDLATGEEIAQ